MSISCKCPSAQLSVFQQKKQSILLALLCTVCVWQSSSAFFGYNQYVPEKSSIRLKDLVGSQTRQVQELIAQIKDPEKFNRLGIDPPSAVILYGEPGTGKTTLARAITGELDASIIAVSGSDITSCYYGETAANLERIFQSARDHVSYNQESVIILLDEMDGVLAGFGTHNDICAKEFLSKMKFEITNTEANKNVYVFATTNYIDDFPKALTRSGRFMTIEVPLPSAKDRAIIFKKYMAEYNVISRLKTNTYYANLALKTALFSGADIREVLQKAAMKAARSDKAHIEEAHFDEAVEDIHERKHLELRRNKFAPEKSNLSLDILAGAQTKRIQLLLKQLKYPEKFEALGASVPQAVLLYGPTGTGKTTLVRGIANYLNANLFALSGPDLEDSHVGGATANIEKLFNNARKMAKCSQKPSVILLDEMDGAISNSTRREILAKLKYELTEDNANVFVFATTNYPEYFPAALTRPGRFLKIEVPLPDEADRGEIYKKYANKYKTEKKAKAQKFCTSIAKVTEGLSCAEIKNILEVAAQEAANNDQKDIKVKDILAAIEVIQANRE